MDQNEPVQNTGRKIILKKSKWISFNYVLPKKQKQSQPQGSSEAESTWRLAWKSQAVQQMIRSEVCKISWKMKEAWNYNTMEYCCYIPPPLPTVNLTAVSTSCGYMYLQWHTRNFQVVCCRQNHQNFKIIRTKMLNMSTHFTL